MAGARSLRRPRADAGVGSASDVSLALEAPRATSVLNVLGATVCSRQDDAQGRSLVQLQVGGARLLARVTRRSAAQLGLQPDQARGASNCRTKMRG